MSADFLIFDFETLSNIPATAPVISLGAIAGKWKDCNTKEELRQSGFYRNIDIHFIYWSCTYDYSRCIDVSFYCYRFSAD